MTVNKLLGWKVLGEYNTVRKRRTLADSNYKLAIGIAAVSIEILDNIRIIE